MGNMHAQELATGCGGMMDISLDTALSIHLQSNHYPPIPSYMIEPCKLAIEAGNDEDWERNIELPEGVEHQGRNSCSASALIEHTHLMCFIQIEED